MGTLQTPTLQESNNQRPRYADSLIISEAVYWEKYYDDPDTTYEWKEGKLEEKPMSDPLNYLVYEWFMALLWEYRKVHAIFQAIGLEIGFRLDLPKETVIRRPDLGIVRNDNPVPLDMEGKTYDGTFDICVESVSDSTDEQVERDTIIKKREYAKAGVEEYYILDAKREYTACYRLNARGVYVPIKPSKDGVMKSKVLPGFQFRLEDLYTRPTTEKMSKDPVYQGFVAVTYQESKKQTELEKKARLKAELQASEAKVIAHEAKAQAVEAKKAQRKAETLAQKAEAQVLEEKQAHQKEKQARQEAEAQAQEEKQARQEAEAQAQEAKQARLEADAEIARLKALLATKGEAV